jgi:hypothetical protein
MKTTLLKGLMAAAPVLLALQSCSDDPISNRSDLSSNEIQFTTSVINASKAYSRSISEDKYSNVTVRATDHAEFKYLFSEVEDKFYNNPLTISEEQDSRGDKVTNSNLPETNHNISVCSYIYSGDSYFDADGKVVGTDVEPYIANMDLKIKSSTNSGTYNTTTTVTHYWPKEENESERKMEFFAIFPSPDEYQPADSNEDDQFKWELGDDNVPCIRTTIDEEMQNQIDYLYCEQSAKISNTPKVTLSMKHITTMVTVSLGSSYSTDDYGIYSVSFDNVGMSGTFNTGTEKWAIKEYGMCAADLTDVEGNTDHSIISMDDNELYFFMLPQTLSSANSAGTPTVEVTVFNKKTNKTEVVKADLTKSGIDWEMGQHVNYVLNDKAVDIEYEIWPEKMSDQGSNVQYDSDGNVTDETEKYAVDNNLDGKYTNDDNYVMFYSYDGTPAGDGETAETTVTTEVDDDTSGSTQARRRTNSRATVSTKYTVLKDYLNVYSVKRVVSEQSSSGTIVGFKVKEVSGENQISSTTEPRSIPSSVYNPQKCNLRVKINLKAQTMTPDESTDDAKILEGHKNKIIQFSSAVNSTDKTSTGHNFDKIRTDFYKYLDLSRYCVDGETGAIKRWPKTDGTGETEYSANCYIITHPGYYKIPVVNGGATFEANNDTKRAIWGTSGTGALGTAVNYHDHAVNAYSYTGWIQYYTGDEGYYYPANNSRTNDDNIDTYLLWQDAKNVIKPYKYSEKIAINSITHADMYYINFSVGVDGLDFKPCNAVIAVKDPNGEILWSYHIWVTPHGYDETFKADTNILGGLGKREFMQYPIGYQQDAKEVYEKRVVELELVQDESDKKATQHVFLVQPRHERQPISCVYYQWGRKDPFPGAKLIENGHMNADGTYKADAQVKPVYDENGSVITGGFGKYLGEYTYTYKDDNGETQSEIRVSHYATIGYSILNPFTFITGHRSIPNQSYWDLWGCLVNDVTDTADYIYPTAAGGSSNIKTIYDPSPIGYKVPSVMCFPAITYDGKNHTSQLSPIIQGTNDESELYSEYGNTPFKSHNEFADHTGFDFYTTAMNGKGNKAGGDTFHIFAFGKIESTTGEFTDVGKQGFYWSATRWCSALPSVYNQRMDFFQVGYTGDKNSGTTFGALQANTESFGFPILPVKMISSD